MNRPSSQRSTFSLTEGSCYDLLKDLPDRSIDLICTDPPYNLGSYSTGNIKLGWRADFNNDIADWDQGQFHPSLIRDEFVRLIKPTGNIFAFTSYNLLGAWHEIFDPLFDTFQFMVWHKTNPPPKFRRAGFLNSCELIVCLWNKGHTWNFESQKSMHNFIETPACGGRERLRKPHHPTQKPLAVLKRLIEISTRPGDTVLDPFAGVASTGVAALQMGRNFIGFELDHEYCDAGQHRLAACDLPLIDSDAPETS